MAQIPNAKVSVGSLDCSFIYDEQFSHSGNIYRFEQDVVQKAADPSVFLTAITDKAFLNMKYSADFCDAKAFKVTISNRGTLQPTLISVPCNMTNIKRCTFVIEQQVSAGAQSCANNGGCQNGSTCVLNTRGYIWCKNCPANFTGSRCEIPKYTQQPIRETPTQVWKPLPPVVTTPVATIPPPPASTDDQAIFLKAHNEARASVGVGPVTWSTTVASSAKRYAETCPSGHSRGQFGENLAWSSGNMGTAQAIKMWTDEKQYYSYDSNSCAPGKVCGHFTQIVWRDTKEIGCAKSTCGNLSILGGSAGTAFVCQYSPPGNYVNTKPY